jgi:hypothetical protein
VLGRDARWGYGRRAANISEAQRPARCRLAASGCPIPDSRVFAQAAKYADTKEPMDFAEFEGRLVKRLDDADLAFELARIIYELDPVWHLVILQLDPGLIAAILRVLLA